MTIKRSEVIQLLIQILLPILTWMLFSQVHLESFFTNHQLSYLFLLALSFSALLSQLISGKRKPIIFIAADAAFLLLCLKGVFSPDSFNSWLLLLDFGLANLLLLTNVVKEPHCRWIIYGLINGSGIVFLFNITAHHYFSLESLMSLTLLIFANIFFSAPLFMKSGNRLSRLIIMGLILAICLSLALAPLKILIIGFILGLYLFLDWRIKLNKSAQQSNIAIFCLLCFSLTAYL